MELLFVVPIIAVVIALCINLNEINPWKEHRHNKTKEQARPGQDQIPYGFDYVAEEDIPLGYVDKVKNVA